MIIHKARPSFHSHSKRFRRHSLHHVIRQILYSHEIIVSSTTNTAIQPHEYHIRIQEQSLHPCVWLSTNIPTTHFYFIFSVWADIHGTYVLALFHFSFDIEYFSTASSYVQYGDHHNDQRAMKIVAARAGNACSPTPNCYSVLVRELLRLRIR